MNFIFELLFLALALVGVVVVAQLVHVQPMLGFALCLAPATWLWGWNSDVAVIQVSGYQAYASDLIIAVLLIAALRRLGAFREWAWTWAGIVGLLAFQLIKGIAAFGLATAINEARGPLYLIGAVSWALTIDWAKQDVIKASLIFGWIFVAVATLHLLISGFGGVNSLPNRGEAIRILDPGPALVLALCASTLIFRNDRRCLALTRVSAVVFTAVVFAAQNRSVWVAFAGGSLAVLFLSTDASSRRKAAGSMMLAGIGAVLVLVGAFGDLLASKLITAATDAGTWNWRIQGWQQLLSPWVRNGPFGWVFGEPYGGGFIRAIDGQVITVSAHNWYVETLLRSGVLGMLLWLTLILRGMSRARKANAAGLFCGAAILSFSVNYFLVWYVAPWIGMLLTIQTPARNSTVITPKSSGRLRGLVGSMIRGGRHRSPTEAAELARCDLSRTCGLPSVLQVGSPRKIGPSC